MNFGKRLRQRREELGLTQAELASSVGVTKSAVGNYETGISAPKEEVLLKLFDALGIDPNYLFQDSFNVENAARLPDNILKLEKKKIPLLGDIACGEPIFAEQEYENYVACGSWLDVDFALRCKGDSMINARIHDGDIVFIKKRESVGNGEIAAVIIDDEATLKRVYISPGIITLQAENPAYPPIIITPRDGKDVRIIGKAVAFQSRVK